jgi:hypothetical protein
MSTSFWKTRAAMRIRAWLLVLMGLGACLLPALGSAQTLSLAQWGQVMKETVPSQPGCFNAAYPSLQWQTTDPSSSCSVQPGQPQSSGTPPPAGYISSAEGSFLNVSGVTSITDSLLGNGNYSIQLNTNGFPLSSDSNSRYCNNSSGKCDGWVQFVYQNQYNNITSSYDGLLQIDYMLTNISSCPSIQWGKPPLCFYIGAYRFIPVGQTAASIINNQLTFRGQTQNGLDTVMMTINDNIYAIVSPSVFNELPQVWNFLDFGVYGFGDGSTANFNSGSTLTERMSFNNGTTATDANSYLTNSWVNDASFNSVTAEHNNLFDNISSPSGCPYNGAQPSFVSVGSTSAGATVPCSSFGNNTITLSVAPAAAVPSTVVSHVPNGVVETFNAAPPAGSGYQLSSITGCGGTLVGNIFVTAPVNADCTISAVFKPLPNTQSYTVTASQGANSTMTPAAGSYAVVSGKSIAFTLTPDRSITGNQLASVGGTCGGWLFNNMDGSYTFLTKPVTANCTVVPVFSTSVNFYAIITSAGTGGTIQPPPNIVTMPSGMPASFLITPNPGNRISSVTGCGGTLSGTIYTTAPVAANLNNCTITASFASASP